MLLPRTDWLENGALVPYTGERHAPAQHTMHADDGAHSTGARGGLV